MSSFLENAMDSGASTIGLCRLCGKQEVLQESHLYPKFVVRWLQRTGGRYFRNPRNPNLRLQDGPKHRLLCFACEQKFGIREKWFSERFFFPCVEDSRFCIAYDSSLYFFALSLLWRTLEAYLRLGHDDALSDWVPTLHSVELEWRRFLADGVPPPTYSGVHIFVVDGGLERSPVHGANMYFSRALDGEVFGNSKRCQVFSKLPRFFFFGEVTPMLQSPDDGTKIDPDGGVLKSPQTLADRTVGSYFVERIAELNARQTQISDRQNRVIEEQLRTDSAHVWGSDLFRAHEADRDVLVTPIVPRSTGRNDLCPCGSGVKFKRCHGER